MAASDYGVLSVRVIEAKDLKAGDWKPYAKLTFEKIKVKTTPAESAQAPVWGTDFKFDVTGPQAELKIEIGDKTTKEFLGSIKIRIESLAANRAHDQWFKLVPKQWKDKVTGSVHLLVTYEARERSTERLTVSDFEILKVLGKGSFGKVMQVAKKDTGCIYAMKALSKDAIIQRDEVEHTRAEQRVLGRINHPFIVGLKFSFQTEGKLYLILDYVNGGELFFHLQQEVRFSPERCRFYAAELALALEYLHGLDIVYRDLKPENILIANDGHLCVTDFGLCKEGMTEGETTRTFCGTAEYLAPEVLKGDGYGKAVDWWSLGVLLFEMLAGLPPFYSDNTNLMYKKIMYSEIAYPDDFPEPTRDIITKLLSRNPATRYGAGPGGAEAVKSHAYFAELNWVKLLAKAIEPPWRPAVHSETDSSNFDPTFTELPAQDSMVDASVLSETMQAQFTGFTFTNESQLART
eukprot:c4131_g1_i1.p1 GENE.c4131_g1_i1~~c4131_g1_i1.p1  ORF type:complete len:463 (+),score=123.84 c4131_g1_i1:47-1435(+)